MTWRSPGTIVARFAKWASTAAGVAGAVLIALNIGTVAAGFALFLVPSVLWSLVRWTHREPSLVVLQGAFTATNLLGVYRWVVV